MYWNHYYSIELINRKLKYLVGDNKAIKNDGKYNQVNGHNSEKTEIYLSSLKKISKYKSRKTLIIYRVKIKFCWW